ncbi:MAG: hypothetical protein ACXW08_00320 [Solirubrobacteraceae bacterium]
MQWGIRQRSADDIVPELQHLSVGDLVPDSRDWSTFFTVVTVAPDRALVLHSTRHILAPMRSNEFTWAFVMQARGEGSTRLLIRARGRMEPWIARLLLQPLISLGDFVNASVMLRGIKTRAERRRTRSATISAPSPRSRASLRQSAIQAAMVK